MLGLVTLQATRVTSNASILNGINLRITNFYNEFIIVEAPSLVYNRFRGNVVDTVGRYLEYNSWSATIVTFNFFCDDNPPELIRDVESVGDCVNQTFEIPLTRWLDTDNVTDYEIRIVKLTSEHIRCLRKRGIKAPEPDPAAGTAKSAATFRAVSRARSSTKCSQASNSFRRA